METQNVEKKSNSKIILIAVIVGVIILGLVIFFIVKNVGGSSGVNILLGKKKGYKLDVPYYGSVEIGDLSMDLSSTDDDLEKAGFEESTFINEYENPNTDDEFLIMTMKIQKI